MEKQEFVVKGDYITLTQLMKALSWVSGGSEAHYFILEGLVHVNGEVVQVKRKKLYPGDVVLWEGMQVLLTRE